MSAVCYIVLIKITLNMHTSTVLTCIEHMWSRCNILCVHYNHMAPFVATIHNMNWQIRGRGGGGGGVNRYTDLGYAFLFLEYCSDALVK